MIVGIICIIAFLSGALAYRTGFVDGQKTGGTRLGPVIKKKHKSNEEEARISRGMNNILNYANRRKGELNG